MAGENSSTNSVKKNKKNPVKKTFTKDSYYCKGVVILPCKCKGNTFQVNFRVVEMEAPTIFGAQTCKDLALLARVHLLQQQNLSVSRGNSSKDV